MSLPNHGASAQTSSSKHHPEKRTWQWKGDGSKNSWDGLRRDYDLWTPNGDCVVYLYDEGQSRRGPSIRIPYDLLFEASCTSLTVVATSEAEDSSYPGHSRGSSNVSGFSSSSGPSDTGPVSKRLYLGAPSDLPRDEAFKWHITTRNFFAWLLGKPLVGPSLGQAMIDLLGRLAIYRDSSVDNVGDLLDYAVGIGYSDCSGRPELALAMLSFADEFKLPDVWIDAFAHCVGMHEDLNQCQEYESTRKVNKALITRAALQMDLHLERSTRAIDSLLEEDLSSASIDLPIGARRHLDHFRSFLQSHFVASYGYWPAKAQSSKELYSSMLAEFESLYHYLADNHSTNEDVKTEQGTLCAGQIIELLNNRHGFESLQFTLPLLPDVNTGAGHRTQAHWALRDWKFGTKDHKQSAIELVRSAYIKASNRTDGSVLDSSLVQAYARFEFELSKSFDDQLSFADARKTRWIMVYQMLQRLISITQAPEEVRDTESASYPLCCPVTGVPPWGANQRDSSIVTIDDARTSRNFQQAAGFSPSQSIPESSSTSFSTDYGVSYLNNQDPYAVSTNPFSNPRLSGALPEKSYRRSLIIPDKALSRSLLSEYAPPSLSIPNRTSSKSSKSSVENGGSSAVSDTDTVPSLNWSKGSPASLTSSDGPRSPLSSSSSVYSTDDLPSEPRKHEEAEVDVLIKDCFADDGHFICPGLSF